MKYIIYPSFIYFNFINKNNYVKYTFNTYFLYHIYNNRYNYLNSILDTFFTIKNKIYSLFPKNKNFEVQKVFLYINLTEYYDVSGYFYKYQYYIHELNKNLILDIYSLLDIKYKENENIRLKIYFIYNNVEYILYFGNNNPIPYPPFSEEIINNYRNDIIDPYYMHKIQKKYFYTLFNIESKDILYIKINNEEDPLLLKYFNMTKTPFNDFGLLYDNPVKLDWVLSENYIDYETFHKLYLKFESMYFNEETFELYDHVIEMTNNQLNDFVISERMKEIIEIKKKEDDENKI
jgi:hypothetical protein